MLIIHTPAGYRKVIGSLIDGRLFTVPCDDHGRTLSLIPVILTAIERPSAASIPTDAIAA